jgi:outer membrane protein assembly factor BamB
VSAACVGVTRPQGWASPAIDGSSAFILEDKDRLTALELTDSSTANVRWSFPDDNRPGQEDLDLEAIYARPLVDGDTIYVVGYSGDLLALNAATGDVLRERNIGGPVVGDILLDTGQLIMATGDGSLLVMAADDFSQVEGWIARASRGTMASGRRQLSTRSSSSSPRCPARWWPSTVPTDGSPDVQPRRRRPDLALLDEGHLFISSLSKEVLILDPANGNVLTDFKAKDWVWNTPAFQDGIAYFGDFSGNVYALDITSGAMVWPAAYDGGSKVKAGPVIIDDVLVLADRQPTVHFIRLSDGSQLNQVPLLDVGTVRSDLVVRDGKALVLTTDGHLFAADPAVAPGQVNEIRYGGGQ